MAEPPDLVVGDRMLELRRGRGVPCVELRPRMKRVGFLDDIAIVMPGAHGDLQAVRRHEDS